MFSPISNRRLVSLHPDPNGFRVEGWAEAIDVGLDQIERIEVYKRDTFTTDLICMDIWLDRTASTRGPVSIHEEMNGFDAVVEGFQYLCGFDQHWREKVLQPPFAENRTVVYERR
jgi:hypothetical protein